MASEKQRTKDKKSASSHPEEERLKGKITKEQDAPSHQNDTAADTTTSEAPVDAEDAQEKDARNKRKSGEVDELFAKLKKTPKEQPQEVPGKKPAKRKKATGSKDDIFGTSSGKARRKDADGFTIYTEDELKVGKGGNTPLCPFDCECCF